MGSYDPQASAFAPLQYVGSDFSNGTVSRTGRCVAGVDNAGFVMGTSSSLFNQAFLQIGRVAGVPDRLTRAINQTLAAAGTANRDVASWPNPFYGYNSRGNANANARLLTLVDGGEALQNVPLQPLAVRERRVDVIFAIDSSADTQTLWPNGTSLVATHGQLGGGGGGPRALAPFPAVPDQNSFVNLGFNRRPTFFGCGNRTGPLVVYLPNTPYTFYSNVSTFDLSYNDSERDQIIRNGYNVATMANGSADANWTVCVACAVLGASWRRTGTAVPAACADCFSRYCWNGTTNSTAPPVFQPQQIITPSPESAGCRVAMPVGVALLSSLLGVLFAVG
ncbi:hypothetical protein UVI_02050800 [Ustilaginoidea virens]|uniref:Lysophospholipase n=1 Tax=Ustilaginoidea virens TaxID=1159556 RepID=A0A1B5L539_USTVR|nr:hypothetical protein UVI_02050800 [Ustilaginoidea virens]